MDRTVAGEAGDFIAEKLWLHFRVGRLLLERSGIGVAMQTFTIPIRLVQRKLGRYLFKVINIDVPQAAQFGV